MRVLFVEDDRNLIPEIEAGLAGIRPRIEVVSRQSRDSALAALEEHGFDLLVCDLKIPTRDGGLDLDVAHGMAVKAEAESRYPGMPVLLLSAFGTVEMLSQLIAEARHGDPFGLNAQTPMLGFVQKRKLPQLFERLEDFSGHIQALEDISVEIEEGCDLLDDQVRIARVFARRHDGRVVRVRSLTGGLSDARTLRMRVERDEGGLAAAVVAKIGDIGVIRDEQDRCARLVAPRLPAGTFAGDAHAVFEGAGATGGLFYSLADDYQRNVFDVLRDRDNVQDVVTRLFTSTAAWREGAPKRVVSVADVRRLSLGDEEMQALGPGLGFEWPEFEGRTLQVTRCCQHGDLHGANALVRADLQPILIDFARVADECVAAYDPVTLELSLVFHPDGRELCGDWPRVDQARSWNELEEYLLGCPFPDFVRACRDWATNVAATQREVLATAYGYAVRQLKYDGTDHELAKAIASGARASF